MTMQRRNDELMNNLRADFQGRYEPNFAWKSATSSMLVIPGLRGCWPMNAFDPTTALDPSGNARHLTLAGNCVYDYENLYPFITMQGTNDWLTRTDEAALDILGTEVYVATSVRGLSMGGWFRPGRAATQEDLMTKWAAAPQQSWYLRKLAANTIQFQVQDGAAANFSVTSTETVSADTWYHIAGTFFANASIEVYVNSIQAQNVAAPVASVRNSTADFRIGANGAGANDYQGDVSMCWLSAMALSESIVTAHYQQTRAMYGV